MKYFFNSAIFMVYCATHIPFLHFTNIPNYWKKIYTARKAMCIFHSHSSFELQSNIVSKFPSSQCRATVWKKFCRKCWTSLSKVHQKKPNRSLDLWKDPVPQQGLFVLKSQKTAKQNGDIKCQLTPTYYFRNNYLHCDANSLTLNIDKNIKVNKFSGNK